MLSQAATAALLGAYGFKCAESVSAAASDEAKAAAAKLGYLKAVAPEVAHRSDAGLVSGKVSNDAELGHAFAALQEKTRPLPGASGTVSVEKFIPHDCEVILGVKYDPTFGPVVLCGLGGIFTEVLKDFALRLAPLAPMDAEDIIAQGLSNPQESGFGRGDTNGSSGRRAVAALRSRGESHGED